jgi:tryptophan-rich sensory protein
MHFAKEKMIQIQLLALFSFLVFWLVEPFGRLSMDSTRSFYAQIRTWLLPKPAAWLFGPVWLVLYVLNAVAGALMFGWGPNQGSTIWIAWFSVYIANYFVNKSWSRVFFGFRLLWTAAVIAMLIFLSAVTVEVLFWVTGTIDAFVIVAGILYVPYVLWSFYAMLLSLSIAVANRKTNFV